MKQITITVPDNCELKQNGNTYTIVEKQKKLTYEDVAKKLFCNKDVLYISNSGSVDVSSCSIHSCCDSNNCTSKNQAEKLLAINKLMNVAKYLNGDWRPDWDDLHERKYYICCSNNILVIGDNISNHSINVYFKSKELSQQAIEILGEETIKLALCTDY